MIQVCLTNSGGDLEQEASTYRYIMVPLCCLVSVSSVVLELYELGRCYNCLICVV